MKTTGSLVAFAASAAAQQFVLYATADESASQRADPIIKPGGLSGHVHDFLGASSFAPELSYEGLQDTDCTTVGAADGTGNSQDNSVYWHPALYAKKKDGSGYMKIPTNSHKMYYRKPAANKYAEPFEFPQGFRMVAGDPFLRSANNDTSTNSQSITQWKCHGQDSFADDGGFPTTRGPCDAYPGLMGTIHFPHCWNGEDFNQDDPHAHMAYPEGNVESGDCPSSHPTALPHIFMENLFDMASVYDEIDPDSLALSQGDDTGYGYHADMFNGWVEGALPELFDTCPQGQYGNHDVGECPSYKPYTKSGSSCKLKNFFEENVAKPGANLCGCNPITSALYAPVLSVAKLGVSTDSCASGSSDDSSSDSGDDYEAPAPSHEIPSYSAPAVSSPAAGGYTSAAAPTTTFATATSAPAPSPTWGGNWGQGSYVDSASEEEDDDEDVEWVTEWVTATAVETAYAKRDTHRHNHMRAHQRRNC